MAPSAEEAACLPKFKEFRAGLLHHIEIYVSDLKRSAEFWGWFLGELGYKEFQRWESGVSYRLDETYIVFVQTSLRHQGQTHNRCCTGLNHLAFHAQSREQVDKLTNLIRERGFNILYADKHPFAGGTDYYALFFEDPDRIKVELVAPDEQLQDD